MVTGKKIAVKGFLAWKAHPLPDIRNTQICLFKLSGGKIQPKTVDIFIKITVKLFCKYSGNIVLVKVQFFCQQFKGERLFKMQRNIADNLMYNIRIPVIISGNYGSLGKQAGNPQIQPGDSNIGGGFRAVQKHSLKC